MSVRRRNSKRFSLSVSPTSLFSSESGSDRYDAGFRRLLRLSGVEPGIYVLAVLLFLPFSPLNRLHVESMAVLATLSWFVSGRSFYRYRTEPIGSVLIGRIAWLIIPVTLLLLFSLWIPNCDWLRGLVYVPLFPVITVVLSVSVAYCLDSFNPERPARGLFWHSVIGVAMLLLGPLYDVGFHPQFYSYNHIFGGILGPIYDEELMFRNGLVVFRLLTLFWAVVVWLIGRIRRNINNKYELSPLYLSILIIIVAYINSGKLGINTTYKYLATQLNEHHETTHFEFYYSTGTISKKELIKKVYISEYYREIIAKYIDINSTSKIRVYIYSTPEERGILTGARYTSVSPIWLSEPQIHILNDQNGSILAHELVHALSRDIGVPIVHASPLIGLVEGLAVAGQPPNGQPTVDDLVIASGFLDDKPAEKLSKALSWWGFWGGRSAVSYTVTGSFVRYLIARYGSESFKRLYRSGNFVSVYGKSAAVLAGEWVSHLRSRRFVSIAARRRALRGFSRPSLFERICPHYVPPVLLRYRSIMDEYDSDRTDSTLRALVTLKKENPEFTPSRTLECELNLASGKPADALRLFHDTPVMSATEAVCQADAHVLAGNRREAVSGYDLARVLYPVSSRRARAELTLRKEAARAPDGAAILGSLLPIVLPGAAGSVRSSRSTRSLRLRALIDSVEVTGPRVPEFRPDPSRPNRSARREPSAARSLVVYYLARALADDGEYRSAANVMGRLISGPVFSRSNTPIRESRRYLELMAARWHYRAGETTTARRHAIAAYEAYLSAGDMDAVRLVNELRQQITMSRADALKKTTVSK